MITLDVFSFGGGIQSTAVMALMVRGDIQCSRLIFANVGEDSENPATLEYIATTAMPYATTHGLNLETVGRPTSLLVHCLESNSTIAVPFRMSNGAPGNRTCTQRWKIEPIAKRLRELRFTPSRPAVMGLGISWDEAHRARHSSTHKHIQIAYPLLDLRLTRNDCRRLITEAGLPMPPRSSCWFCPYHRLAVWSEMKRSVPELFRRSVELEQAVNRKRKALGKDAVFLSSRAKPLTECVEDGQPGLFDDANCESGHCLT